MGNVRVVVNRAAIREIVQSQRMLDEVRARARRIARAAGGETDYRVDAKVGRKRARAAVITATPRAMVDEARHRTLTRALDAAR